MGTGAAVPPPAPPLLKWLSRSVITNTPQVTPGRKDSLGTNQMEGHNVISNEVAPILKTKGCFEEYQCTMLAEKQTVTKGRKQEGLPEHPLITGESHPRNLKGGNRSFFDPCVNAMGLAI